MKPNTVAVAYLHPGEVSHSFHRSMRHYMTHDLLHNRRLYAFLEQECGTARIADGRNSAVRQFLASQAEWMVFVDADMGFEPDAIDRLIDAADPDERPIVGGLCFAYRRGPSGPLNDPKFQPVPTIYQWYETDTRVGMAPIYDYPKNTLMQVDATGGAFFAVHRRVLEEMSQSVFPGSHPTRPWFDETPYKDQVFSEDITFFRRAIALDFPVHVHTGIQTSHHKHTYLTEQTVGDLTEVPTYVVIPMKNRMDLTRTLLKQIRDQGGYEKVLLFDNGSNKATKNELSCLPDDVEVFDADGWNIHQMWNAGIEWALSRSWPVNVAVLNNDIEIGPGFLEGLGSALRSDPLLAAVSPNYDGRQGEGVQYVSEICAGRYDGTGGLAGFAFMLKGEAGYRFPEDLQWHYGDNDMMAAILTAGSKAGIVYDTTCTHVDGGSQTGRWDDPEMAEILAADRDTFRARWGLDKVKEAV